MAITTGQEFIDTIMAGMSSDINDLPQPQAVAWFNDPLGKATIFRMGQSVPFDEFSFVAGIFHDDAVIRVYTVPRKPPEPKPEAWTIRRPTRYILSRTAPTYVSETMNLEIMATEIIDEWDQLAVDMSSAEVEREAIIAHIEGFGTEAISGPSLIEELRDEVHLEEDDEDEEETETAEGVGAPPAPPVVVAPTPAAPPEPPVST
jgi:hypothetical protein